MTKASRLALALMGGALLFLALAVYVILFLGGRGGP